MTNPRLFRRRRPHTLQVGGRPFVSLGLSHRFADDIYHRALTVRWPVFFGVAAALFLLLNALFAALFLLGQQPIANQYPHGFLGAFFFSVETLSTVGYGDMHPQSLYGHVVATVEIFTGMASIALATGLIFSRFSRPRARIIFADHPVVRTVDGYPTLMIRAANRRQNIIAAASAQLHVLRLKTSPEGFTLRKIEDLKLVREHHPIFMLSWLMMHVIDESSPLYGETDASLRASSAIFLLTIEGLDTTTSQAMMARQEWPCEALRWSHQYVDLVRDDGQGVSIIDYARFHEVRPSAEAAGPGPQAREVP